MSATDSKPHLVDCNYPEKHEAHHHEHAETGRLVCHVCHPPIYVLQEHRGKTPE